MVSFPKVFPTRPYKIPSSNRSILILSTQLRLGLPSCLFPSGFPNKNLHNEFSPQIQHNIIYPFTPRSPSGLFPTGLHTKNLYTHSPQIYFLILTTHLRLGLPSGLFPSGFRTKILYTPSPQRSTLIYAYVSPVVSSTSPQRANLILSAHLLLCLPSGLFRSGFPTKNLFTALSPQTHPNNIHHLRLRYHSGFFPSGLPTKILYTPSPQRSIIILSTHQRLVLARGLFPSSFLTKSLYTALSPKTHPYIIHPSTSRSPKWSLTLQCPTKTLLNFSPQGSILILSTHLGLVIPNGIFSSGFKDQGSIKPSSQRSILILNTHLRLGLPSGLFPSGFTTKTLYTHLPHRYILILSSIYA